MCRSCSNGQVQKSGDFCRHFWEGRGRSLFVASVYKYVRSKMCFYVCNGTNCDLSSLIKGKGGLATHVYIYMYKC